MQEKPTGPSAAAAAAANIVNTTGLVLPAPMAFFTLTSALTQFLASVCNVPARWPSTCCVLIQAAAHRYSNSLQCCEGLDPQKAPLAAWCVLDMCAMRSNTVTTLRSHPRNSMSASQASQPPQTAK